MLYTHAIRFLGGNPLPLLMEAITNHINKNCLPKARTSAARPPVAIIPQADDITEGQIYDNSATDENLNQPTEISTVNPVTVDTTTAANTTATITENTSAAEGSKRRFGHPGVMIEYILISGVNDMPHIAHELGRV